MAFEFHSDWVTYFKQQYENSKNFVLPFIAANKNIGQATAFQSE